MNKRTVVVESAAALTEAQKTAVLAVLHEKLGDADVSFSLETDLLGGLRVTIDGSEQYDASVLGKLRSLQTNVR
jgi:F0F1-type ATP synthase delta subunit